MALALGAFVMLMFCDHHRQDDGGAMTSLTSRNGRTGALMALARARDGRPRLRQRAALPAVLPGHRLRAAPPRCGRRAQAPGAVVGKIDLGPLRRQYLVGAAVGVQARAPDRHGRDRRARDGLLHARRTCPTGRSPAPRPSTSRPRRPGNISPRSSASASPSRRSSRARKCGCRWSTTSIPTILDDPDAREISEITLSYTFYPVDQPKTAELEQPAMTVKQGR